MARRKQSYLLLELLIAIGLVSLSLVLFLPIPSLSVQRELLSLMKMQIREEADRTFATLIEQLAKREIPKRQILSPTAWTYEGLSAPCTIVLGEHMQYRIDRTVRLSAPEKDTTSTHFLVKVTIEFGASKQVKALRKRTFVYQIAFINTATPTHT